MSSNAGRRRKNDSADREEELRRKIRRLERKIAKEQERQQISLSPSSNEDLSDEVIVQDVTNDVIVHAPQPQHFDPDFNDQNQGYRNETDTQNSQTEMEVVRQSPQEATQVSDPVPGTSNESTEVLLDDDILELLGDAPKMESALGKPIHKDLASRWQEILSKGLPKEVKEKLLSTYQIPNNCELLLAPLLNPEAKAALPDTLVKRDSYLMYKQRQLGLALSALGNAIDLIITNQTSDKQALLRSLSDAGRILCNVHFSETKTRRKLVISSVNTSIKETLTDTNRDKLLFGENVTEKLRAAKTIQKSGEMLKNTTRFFPKNNFNNKQQNRLNSKPHRKMNSKQPSSSQSTSDPARYRQQQAPAPSRQQQAAPQPLRGRSPPRKPYQQRR